MVLHGIGGEEREVKGNRVLMPREEGEGRGSCRVQIDGVPSLKQIRWGPKIR